MVKNNTNRKSEAKEFAERIDAMGLSQRNAGFLMGRTTRSINYYVNGHRKIPPHIWVKLQKLEVKDRDSIRRVLARCE